MHRGNSTQDLDIQLEGGSFTASRNEDVVNAVGFNEPHSLNPQWIGAAIAPELLPISDAQQIAWEGPAGRMNQDTRQPHPTMTVASFVQEKFVPEHVAVKRYSGRTHYQAILKHVLTPEEVNRVFQVDPDRSRARLKAVPDWPYIGGLRLCDARHDHVQQLIAAAIERGYSAQTVTHIRNVVSRIFSHAKKERCFAGDNPASRVVLPGMIRKTAYTLNLAQTRAMLEVMRYPEKEMTLIAILTDMNVAEICGLQWKCVNLSSSEERSNGHVIPPRSIAIRSQWYRGELGSVKEGRKRNLPIPALLYTMLVKLSHRTRFTGPDDFVLVSQAGTPINETNIATRRLKSIGRALEMPWLSWRVVRRSQAALVNRA